MKRLRYADEAWLIDDGVADAIMERATRLAKLQEAETLSVNVLTEVGKPEVVSFLIGPATMMTVETTDSTFPEPDNSQLRERLTRPVIVQPTPVAPLDYPDEF